MVALHGSTWQATKDTGQAPPHKDWIGLAVRGVDGITPQPRGLWRVDESYRALDIVALNGGSFIARKDDPGPCPGDGWQLLASQGRNGKAGETGPRGELGPRGPRGDKGEPAPRLILAARPRGLSRHWQDVGRQRGTARTARAV